MHEIVNLPDARCRLANYLRNEFRINPNIDRYFDRLAEKKRPLMDLLGFKELGDAVKFTGKPAPLSDFIPANTTNFIVWRSICWLAEFGESCVRVTPASIDQHDFSWSDFDFIPPRDAVMPWSDGQYEVFKNGKSQKRKLIRMLKKQPWWIQAAAYQMMVVTKFPWWPKRSAGCAPPWDIVGPQIGEYLAGFQSDIYLTADPVSILSSGITRSSISCHAPDGSYRFGPFAYVADPAVLVAISMPSGKKPTEYDAKVGRTLFIVPDVDIPAFIQARTYGTLSNESLSLVRDYIERSLREKNGLLPGVWGRDEDVHVEGPEQCYIDADCMTSYALRGYHHRDYVHSRVLCPSCLSYVDSDEQEDGCCIGGNTCCVCGDHVHSGDFRTYGDYIYCESCFDEEFVYCERCGDNEPRDGSAEVQRNGYTETWCQHCVERYASSCWQCDTLVDNNRLREAGGHYLCQECYDDHTDTCADCGEQFMSEDLSGDCRCEACEENHTEDDDANVA